MVKVAVAQVEIFADTRRNVRKILDFIDQAVFKSADIVCFPESCLGETALSLESEEIKTIQRQCKEKKIYCIVGAHIKENEKT